MDSGKLLTLDDTVTFNGSGNITLSGNVTDAHGTLQVGPTATLNLNGVNIGGTSGLITDQGAIDIIGNSTFNTVDVSGGGNLTVALARQLEITGNSTFDGINVNGLGNITVDSGKLLTLDDTVTFNGSGNITLSGNVADDGTLQVGPTATLNLNGVNIGGTSGLIT